MSPLIPTKSYNFFLRLLFHVWLTNFSCQATLRINDNHIRCHDNESVALLQFKQGIDIDDCGLLDSWGDTRDCCQWSGIHCNNHSSHVTSLNIPGNPYSNPCLEGTLNVSLLELKHLKTLNLGNNKFRGQIPKFIGSLGNLEYLDLSHAGFSGIIPSEIGNLSRLSSLFLNCHDKMDDTSECNMRVESLWWLSKLRLLKVVDLSGIDLSATSNNWLSIINSLPFLQDLHLEKCKLSLKLSTSLAYGKSSTTLNNINLSENNLNDTSLFQWLSNLSGLDTNLIHLDLSNNQMFGNNLILSRNAMKFLDYICSLETLSLSSTNLNYSFTNILESFSGCSDKSLQYIDLSSNQVWGPIPDNIVAFSSLMHLDLSHNQLNGTIPQSIGQLTLLYTLDLSYNSLKGTLTNAHLSNCSELALLDLGDNTDLAVKVTANWIPTFQLYYLNLKSCIIGPSFPTWISTQKHIHGLDISNTSIKDTIPYGFWNSSFLSNMDYLDMSQNLIYGTLPNISSIYHNVFMIDLSFNKLEGALPIFLRNNISNLFMNNNKFSEGLVPFLCSKNKSSLSFLSLSNNLFSDKLPDCWGNFDQLSILHLENNNLWGNLPNSIGVLDQLIVLHLNNNKLSGELSTSLLNCSSLIVLVLANNLLTGYIPPSIGYIFKNLSTLNLHNNKFFGGLPSTLCHLSRLQLLDISDNKISGTIPKCLNKLKGMSNTIVPNLENDDILFERDSIFTEFVPVMWKRREQSFSGNNSLKLLKGIDLSNNILRGLIPDGISSLLGLNLLNLSRNNLRGAIMSKLGQLTSLESLDLSHNHLSGEIPTSLAQISSLDVLDFSYNNLSGKIPEGTQLQTFDASAYMGNPLLCGAPLQKCVIDETTSIPENLDDEHNTDAIYLGLYISAVLGFITGFWGICGTLVLKRSWRHAFFRFYENAKDKIYVMLVVNVAKVWRRS